MQTDTHAPALSLIRVRRRAEQDLAAARAEVERLTSFLATLAVLTENHTHAKAVTALDVAAGHLGLASPNGQSDAPVSATATFKPGSFRAFIAEHGNWSASPSAEAARLQALWRAEGANVQETAARQAYFVVRAALGHGARADQHRKTRRRYKLGPVAALVVRALRKAPSVTTASLARQLRAAKLGKGREGVLLGSALGNMRRTGAVTWASGQSDVTRGPAFGAAVTWLR
jgi:hypothetical protein